jgi:hypothetical protein
MKTLIAFVALFCVAPVVLPAAPAHHAKTKVHKVTKHHASKSKAA